jgi:hypothetical protein
MNATPGSLNTADAIVIFDFENVMSSAAQSLVDSYNAGYGRSIIAAVQHFHGSVDGVLSRSYAVSAR